MWNKKGPKHLPKSFAKKDEFAQARRGLTRLALCLVCSTCSAASALAQVSLADDIIMAAQGKENAERQPDNKMGPLPGSAANPYRRQPGSSDILLGADPNRRARGVLRPPELNEGEFVAPLDAAGRPSQRLLQSRIERLPDARGAAKSNAPPAADDEGDELSDPEGPAFGLTLDAAIERLVRANRGLRSKALEIPQADADVLTAGLRSNPLLFYSADNVPYGSYSAKRPGEVSHGLSVVYPLDYSGKRQARVTVAEHEKRILEAQYQDAVRREIDRLASEYVDALSARRAALAGERTLASIDELLRSAGGRVPRGAAEEEQIDDLIIDRDVAAISLGDARQRYQKAKENLAARLELPAAAADRLELRGAFRVAAPKPPPVETLINLALRRRPDLIAQRLGVERANAQIGQERAERFSDAYLLYSPFLYRNNSATGGQNATSWGAGVFASAPIFNRNQGNLRRAGLNVAQARHEVAALERKIIAEVRQAAADLDDTAADVSRLEQITLPAVGRKRDRARSRLTRGEIDTTAYLEIQRDTAPLVRYYRDALERHRRNMLKLNTAVGQRILP